MERGEKRGEKIGEIRGRLSEIHDVIQIGFESKFSQLSTKLLLSIQNITEMDKLKEIQKALFVINDADEFKQFVQKRI